MRVIAIDDVIRLIEKNREKESEDMEINIRDIKEAVPDSGYYLKEGMDAYIHEMVMDILDGVLEALFDMKHLKKYSCNDVMVVDFSKKEEMFGFVSGCPPVKIEYNSWDGEFVLNGVHLKEGDYIIRTGGGYVFGLPEQAFNDLFGGLSNECSG